MAVTPAHGSYRYLSFSLDGDLLGLEISRVRGVVDASAVNRIFDGHSCVRGVVNLGGDIVPIVDLRPRFADTRGDPATDTCVIVAEVDSEGKKTALGILAGCAHEVLSLEPAEIGPGPAFVAGVARRGGRRLLLLDLDLVFSGEELAAIRASYHYVSAPDNERRNDVAARRSECERKLNELHRRYERLPTTSRTSALLDEVHGALARCALAVRRPRAAPSPSEGETHPEDVD